MSTLGGRIRQVRQEQKLSQQDFAERLGISQSFLSDMERDVKVPGGDTLLSLKRSFGISLDWLLTGELDVLVEGDRIGPRSNALGGAAGGHEIAVLRQRVDELEKTILTLQGQITAYREMLTTLKP